jgi:large subunit ribosomal protein L16
MFEIDGVPAATAHESLALGAAKLPIRCRTVTRVGG